MVNEYYILASNSIIYLMSISLPISSISHQKENSFIKENDLITEIKNVLKLHENSHHFKIQVFNLPPTFDLKDLFC
jgi:hypothetical protein